ncbi:MAG TPA: hypothetical protein VHL11_00500 [Phototrophicaceae bacterium]|nr:hypothetical protein [Phototrophicaceae bacterium]
MQAITRRVESLGIDAPGDPVPVINAAPELSQSDQQQRTAKLKKARW